MKVIKELDNILWHEVGHLLIDILMVEKHTDLYINELVIRNYDCQNVSWCGWVKLEPDILLTYDEVIKSKSLISFKFLSLYSGCLFQSLYTPEENDLKDCFAFKKEAIGKGDYDQSSELMSRLMKNHSELRGNMDFFDCHNSIIYDEFKTKFMGNDNLKKELSPIIKNEVEKIHADILANNDMKRYSYNYSNEELDELIKSISEVIAKLNLRELINGLVVQMVDNLKKHTK